MKKYLWFLFFLITNNSYALTCQEAFQIFYTGTTYHINKPKLDGNLISRSGELYLDQKDPMKIFLTNDERNEALKKFSLKQDEIVSNLMKNNCSTYDILDQYVSIGEKRWKKILTDELNTPTENVKEIIRDLTNLKVFQSIDEINEYGRYFVQKYLKTNQLNEKKKLSDIKQEFKKLFIDDSKKNKVEQSVFIAKSLFMGMDPHSSYISEEESAAFDSTMSGKLHGIGVMFTEDELGAKVVKILKNSPAAKTQKMKKDDIIIKVNDIGLGNKNDFEIAELIKGKIGTKVKLTISRKDLKTNKETVFDLFVERGVVSLDDQKVLSNVQNINDKNILIINIPGFYYDSESNRGMTIDVIESYLEAKSKHKKIDGIVVDLRYNGGGILEEAIRLVGLFIKEEIAVQVKDNDGIKGYQAGTSPILIEEPLVVLISRSSASASEIFAGAIKDHRRGLIVGDDRTYGKGTVQMVSDQYRRIKLGKFKVTMAQFFTPKGSSTQLKGVESDIVIPSSTQLYANGEKTQKFAMEWGQVPAAIKHTQKDYVSSFVDTLSTKSKFRISENKDFKKYDSLSNYNQWMESPENKKDTDKDEEENRFDLFRDIILKEALMVTNDYISVFNKMISQK